MRGAMEGNKTTFIYDHFWAHDQKLPDLVQTQLQTWFFAINLQDRMLWEIISYRPKCGFPYSIPPATSPRCPLHMTQCYWIENRSMPLPPIYPKKLSPRAWALAATHSKIQLLMKTITIHVSVLKWIIHHFPWSCHIITIILIYKFIGEVQLKEKIPAS